MRRSPTVAWLAVIAGLGASTSCAPAPELAPAPARDVVADIKAAFQAGRFPSAEELQRLRGDLANLLDSASADSLIIDTTAVENHARWMAKEHLREIDPNDPDNTIEGPPGRIIPTRNSQFNTASTLADGRWIARFDIGEPGFPGRNLPAGTSYLLVILLDSALGPEMQGSIRQDNWTRRVCDILTIGDHAVQCPATMLPGYDPAVSLPGFQDVSEGVLDHIEDLGRERAGVRGEAADGFPLGSLLAVIVPVGSDDVRFNMLRHYPTPDPEIVARGLWLEGSNDNSCMNGCQGWCDGF